MALTIPEITLQKSKGKPAVEIIFGQAHVGNYRFFLWDIEGKNPELLSHGNNVDDVLDTFEIDETPANLDGRILSYEVIVQAAEARPEQLYSVNATVRQQGEVVSGGVISETGKFTDAKSIIGFRRLKL
jgi:hypothetical protein